MNINQNINQFDKNQSINDQMNQVDQSKQIQQKGPMKQNSKRVTAVTRGVQSGTNARVNTFDNRGI